jgi:hypothetical protein
VRIKILFKEKKYKLNDFFDKEGDKMKHSAFLLIGLICFSFLFYGCLPNKALDPSNLRPALRPESSSVEADSQGNVNFKVRLRNTGGRDIVMDWLNVTGNNKVFSCSKRLGENFKSNETKEFILPGCVIPTQGLQENISASIDVSYHRDEGKFASGGGKFGSSIEFEYPLSK